MSYNPTLFLPIHFVVEMNKVLLPIENAMRTLAITPTLNESSQQTVAHNLQCFAAFRKAEQQLIEDYAVQPITVAKSLA